MKKIYPRVEVLKAENRLTYRTFIRKKDNHGVWWLCQVVRTYYDYGPMNEIVQVNDFHGICYTWLIEGKPVKEMYLPDGSLLWEVDINQEDEELRLSRAYKFGL